MKTIDLKTIMTKQFICLLSANASDNEKSDPNKKSRFVHNLL